jgi:triacylglycerol esterase/lipase EstA (alpha/beta hydrolase family)
MLVSTGLVLALAAALAAFAGCAAAPEAWPARGRIGLAIVDTMVDSQQAAVLLAGGADTEGALLAPPASPDAAALIFARQIERQSAADPLVARYRAHLARGRDSAVSLAGRTYLLVPGWLWRADPTSGADLEPQARVLRAVGARVIRAETAENGSVESNALLIADTLRDLAAAGVDVTVVSASKGGAEAALALSQLAQRDEAAHVQAWVNIGGTLGGTALADLALTWPTCWFVEAAVLPDDRSFEALRSITTAASAERARSLRLPAHLRTVNLIGIALSGQISPRARLGYRMLRRHGANDGITLLGDALAPNASTIVVLGADHFFALPDIDVHTLAVAAALSPG